MGLKQDVRNLVKAVERHQSTASTQLKTLLTACKQTSDPLLALCLHAYHEQFPVHAVAAACLTPVSPLCLHFAAGSGDLPLLRQLLRCPSLSVNATDSRQRTPLFWASRNNRRDAVELLLRQGADSRWTDKEGKTAADVAANFQLADLIRKEYKR